MDPETAALLAVSGPATPSMAPFPNFSGASKDVSQPVGEESWEYGPGARKDTQEKAEPRAPDNGPEEAYQSFSVGKKFRDWF